MQCPACRNDISDFLKNPQISRELMGMIESLQHKTGEEIVESLSEESLGTDIEHSETEGEDNESRMLDVIEVQQNYLDYKFEHVYKRRKVGAYALVSESTYVDAELPFNKRTAEPSCQCTEDEKTRVKCSGTKRQVGGQVVHNFLEKVYERRKVDVKAFLPVANDSGNLSSKKEIAPVCGGMEDKEMSVEDNSTESKDGTEGVHKFLMHKSDIVYQRKVNLDAMLLKPGDDTFSIKEDTEPLQTGTEDVVTRFEDNEIQRQDSTKVLQNLEEHELDCKWRKAEECVVSLNPESTENSEPKE